MIKITDYTVTAAGQGLILIRRNIDHRIMARIINMRNGGGRLSGRWVAQLDTGKRLDVTSIIHDHEKLITELMEKVDSHE
jgi:hypothetical protein